MRLVFAACYQKTNLRASGDLESQIYGMLERDLATAGSTSNTISFSYVHSSSLEDCFDFGSFCYDWAFANSGSISLTSGNAYSEAYIQLYAESCCESFALAYGAACAFTKGSGKINVTTASAVVGGVSMKSASLGLALDTAVTTLAFAATKTEASAYAAVDTFAYTDAAAYCDRIDDKSPFCLGFAGAGLVTIGKATAGAKGQSSALAASGAVTSTRAAVQAFGSGLASVNGVITAYSGSWAYASSSSTSSAFAAAFSASVSGSFAAVCAGLYESHCADTSNSIFEELCSHPAEESCSLAFAAGEGYTGAFATACADACASAYAESSLFVDISANVDCGTAKPKLTYSCAKANARTSCST